MWGEPSGSSTRPTLCFAGEKPPGGRNDEVDIEIKQEIGVGTDSGEQEGTPTHGAGGVGCFQTGHSATNLPTSHQSIAEERGSWKHLAAHLVCCSLDTARLCFCVYVLHGAAGSFDSQNTDGEGNGWDTPRV